VGITRLFLVYKRLQCSRGVNERLLGACLRIKRRWHTLLKYGRLMIMRLVGVNIRKFSNLVISKDTYIGCRGMLLLFLLNIGDSKGKRW